MPATHGTRSRYIQGCRCDECRRAQADYQARYRDVKLNGELTGGMDESAPVGPGPAELAVQAGLAGLASAQARPELVAAALEMARVLDHPRAMTAKPAAARQLADISERLHKGTGGRKSRLASVRDMSRQAG